MGHQVLGKVEWSAIVMMLLTVVLVVSCSEGRAEAEKEPIVFSDLNWTSAQFQNRVAQYIVEKGYGYPTDVVFGATLPLLQGLRRGDTQVTMEIWLPNQTEAWMAAQESGEVVTIGESLGKDWQSAFVIPAYMQDQYPELNSVEDLKEERFRTLFATPETDGKARLVSCAIGWVCEEVNAQQIEGYGLSDHIYVVNPGDGAAADASLYGAYESGEPWLGYQWGTNEPAVELDLIQLKEPAYSRECWSTTKACAYEPSTITIAVRSDLIRRAPDIVEMLRSYELNIDRYKEVGKWRRENRNAGINDTALWWLKRSLCQDLCGKCLQVVSSSSGDGPLAAHRQLGQDTGSNRAPSISKPIRDSASVQWTPALNSESATP